MTTSAAARLEENRDTASSDSSNKDLKLFLTTEFSKVNENIRQVDYRLTLIEGKLDLIERTNKQLQKDVTSFFFF